LKDNIYIPSGENERAEGRIRIPLECLHVEAMARQRGSRPSWNRFHSSISLIKNYIQKHLPLTHLEANIWNTANTTYHAALVQNNIEEIFSSGARKV
jgi:hypothetical protein